MHRSTGAGSHIRLADIDAGGDMPRWKLVTSITRFAARASDDSFLAAFALFTRARLPRRRWRCLRRRLAAQSPQPPDKRRKAK